MKYSFTIAVVCQGHIFECLVYLIALSGGEGWVSLQKNEGILISILL